MNYTLDDDLGRWEEGELPLEELEAYHPGTDVRGVAALHGLLSRIAMEPVPDPEESWGRVRDRLPSGVSGRRAGAGLRIPRRLVAAIAAVMLMATAAYAASPEGVKDALGGLWNDIGSMFQGDDGSPGTSVSVPATDEREDADEGPVTGSTDEEDETDAPDGDLPGGTGPGGNEAGTDEGEDPGDDQGAGEGSQGDEDPDSDDGGAGDAQGKDGDDAQGNDPGQD